MMTRNATLLLILVAACDPEPTASLSVTLQRFNEPGNCWETALFSDETPAKAGDLGLPAFCASTAARTLLGGVDRARLLVVYHDVEFETTASLPPPTIDVRLDGIPETIAFDVEPRRIDKTDKLLVIAGFYPPTREADDVRITVTAAAGLEETLPKADAAPLPLVAPTLGIVYAGCPATGTCSLPGGVGTTPIDITLPSHSGGDATLTWTLGDIPQPDARSITLKQKGDVITARDFVPVPASDQKWKLTARFGNLEQPGGEIQLTAPQITAKILGCGSPCTVEAGSTQTLRVVAPRGIRTPAANVSTYTNGAPSLADVLINLTTEDVAANTIEGDRELTVPNSPNKTWTVDARVSGFRAETFTATIQ
ncbi:MAG: hypothetical protein HOV81_29835 [Kofleriaceae bacterium]|nr:hypothetical protein [Kofleriaceae bacterium]